MDPHVTQISQHDLSCCIGSDCTSRPLSVTQAHNSASFQLLPLSKRNYTMHGRFSHTQTLLLPPPLLHLIADHTRILCFQVVRALSYWCSDRGGSGITLSRGRNGAGQGFLELLRPRLKLPAFIGAAESLKLVRAVCVCSLYQEASLCVNLCYVR